MTVPLTRQTREEDVKLLLPNSIDARGQSLESEPPGGLTFETTAGSSRRAPTSTPSALTAGLRYNRSAGVITFLRGSIGWMILIPLCIAVEKHQGA
jgi:hypothetical protein